MEFAEHYADRQINKRSWVDQCQVGQGQETEGGYADGAHADGILLAQVVLVG